MLELIRTLLQAWKTIVGITIVCVGLAVAYALHAPEVFKAETLLAPASEEKSGASSALSQFGGLAAMAGISIPSDSNVEQVVATLKSRKFLRQYIDGKKLLPVLFEEIWDAENQSWLVQTQEDEPTEQKAVESFKEIFLSMKIKNRDSLACPFPGKIQKSRLNGRMILVKQFNEQLREKAIADSQKTGRVFRTGISQDHLAGHACRALQPARVRKTESHACQCKRGLCPRSNRPRCCSRNPGKAKAQINRSIGRCLWRISWHLCGFLCSVPSKIKIFILKQYNFMKKHFPKSQSSG